MDTKEISSNQKELIPMEFISTHGTLYVNEDGTIHPDSDIDDWLGTIHRVDIEELDNYLSYYDFDINQREGGDVLDFGYWDKDGEYHAPEKSWREDVFHRVIVDSDPDEAKAYWTKERIQEVIDESFEWIKIYRL